eukprot:COSAG04_NODE_21112_length_379_cov_2.492857_1_plen_70_part_01
MLAGAVAKKNCLQVLRPARCDADAAELFGLRSCRRSTYGVLGPYKIERYAKLPQRSKTVTTGLGSIKTTW